MADVHLLIGVLITKRQSGKLLSIFPKIVFFIESVLHFHGDTHEYTHHGSKNNCKHLINIDQIINNIEIVGVIINIQYLTPDL